MVPRKLAIFLYAPFLTHQCSHYGIIPPFATHFIGRELHRQGLAVGQPESDAYGQAELQNRRRDGHDVEAFCHDDNRDVVPFYENTPFWSATEGMSLAEHLSSRFRFHFQKCEWVAGRMVDCPKGDSETTLCFYVSDSFIIKAYMNVTGSDRSNVNHLGQSLHEAAATAFVCRKKRWNFKVFGVRTDESTHICLLRARLISRTSTADETANACIDLLVTTGVAHGDPHPGNVFQGVSGFEVVDCERSFLIEKNLQSEMTRSIQTFANNPQSRTNLLNEFRSQGLEDTRHRFLRLAKRILDGSRDISTLRINELLAIFQKKN